MHCVNCGNNTSVTNSRPSKKAVSVWRRRHCPRCDLVFSTYEQPDLSLSVKVKTKSGQIEAFSEEKLLLSLYECFSHRKDALSASVGLKTTILNQLFPLKHDLLDTKHLAEQVYRVIFRFDRVAATYYKAHHPF